jgi:hypothetical protein
VAQWPNLETATIREWATDAIRYWEPRRILYNLVLAAIVLAYFVMGLPTTKGFLTVNFLLMLFLLAVLANVAYCAAYAVDIFAQISGFREVWQRVRWGAVCHRGRVRRRHYPLLVNRFVQSRTLTQSLKS